MSTSSCPRPKETKVIRPQTNFSQLMETWIYVWVVLGSRSVFIFIWLDVIVSRTRCNTYRCVHVAQTFTVKNQRNKALFIAAVIYPGEQGVTFLETLTM